MSEFVCRKHGYHDETKTHSCPDCYADWLAAEPKAPPYGGTQPVDSDIFGKPDADGWYQWNGGRGFRPAGKVDYVCREYDGYDYTDADAQYLRWEHENESDDIVKWRPANPGCRRIGCSHEICEDKE